MAGPNHHYLAMRKVRVCRWKGLASGVHMHGHDIYGK